MKRKALSEFNGEEKTFTGYIANYGSRKVRNKKGKVTTIKTALIREVQTLDGRPMTGHIWVDWYHKPNLEPGTKIEFKALVREYIKGYKGSKRNSPCFAPELAIDFGLKKPHDIKVLKTPHYSEEYYRLKKMSI